MDESKPGRNEQTVRPQWTVAYLVAAGLVVTGIVAIFTLLSVGNVKRDVDTLVGRDFEHAAIVADIVWYDEILTMSAHLAAASGDLSWMERYLAHEPKLTEAIESSMTLSPSAYATTATSETDAANDALVAMEMRAFELIEAGSAKEAYALLTSPEYVANKRTYADGMGKARGEIEASMASRVHDALGRLEATQTSAATGALVLIGVWSVVIFLVCRSTLKQARVDRELVEARLRAEAATRAKADFLANMSHEIRTPLNGVIGMTELLGHTTLDEEQLQFLANARSSGESLLHVVDDILDYSKITAGKLTIESAPFDLVATLEDVATLLAPRAAANDVEVLLSIGDDVPHWLLGDPTRLKQVLMNLVGNAVKFTVEGEIRIEARAAKPPATETEAHEPFDLQLSVTDTGIGIAADRIPSLFVPFEQADSSTTRRFGGTGLGLTISRRLTELMGGELSVTSEVGRGTSFSARLPFLPAPGVADTTTGTWNGSARVLVVEDHAGARQILERMLASLQCEVQSVGSAEEALELLHRDEVGFDIAMIDCLLPGLSGVELTCLLSEQGTANRLHTVLMSADPVQTSDRRCQVDARLLKPIRRHQLRDMLIRSAGGQVLPARVSNDDEALLEELRAMDLHVLVAEDNPVNQRVVQAILRRAGVSIDLAENGRVALEHLARGTYDLVLMDCQMPVLDGYAACRAIRASERGRGGVHLPVLALTAHALDFDHQKCIDAGMDDYLTKPVRPIELFEAIARAVRPQENRTKSR